MRPSGEKAGSKAAVGKAGQLLIGNRTAMASARTATMPATTATRMAANSQVTRERGHRRRGEIRIRGGAKPLRRRAEALCLRPGRHPRPVSARPPTTFPCSEAVAAFLQGLDEHRSRGVITERQANLPNAVVQTLVELDERGFIPRSAVEAPRG